ncbi:hypothetical protein Scep_002124 [Stephania cephalantha]|uniref:Trehalose 6-phosphate phosphatase n=1 Tax=Stephania cephalantha TaxID=152367 RepID=A0AAP0L9G1_9MAGN
MPRGVRSWATKRRDTWDNCQVAKPVVVTAKTAEQWREKFVREKKGERESVWGWRGLRGPSGFGEAEEVGPTEWTGVFVRWRASSNYKLTRRDSINHSTTTSITTVFLSSFIHSSRGSFFALEMTKQNVVVAETKSGLAITVAVSNSSLFTVNHQMKPPSATTTPAAGYIAISPNKLLKKLETGGMNAWVESIRASSPTHIKSIPTSLSSSIQDYTSWMLHHPSALNMFEQITSASKGKQIVMFLDYDGTLSPIVEDPDRAFMSEGMRIAVKNVARYFPTAIVSGRCRDKVYSFVRLTELYYAGSHGMDIKGPSKSSKNKKGSHPVLFQPASEFLPMIDEVYKVLVERTKSIPGAKVENNKFCASVHFRCVDEKSWSPLADQVKSVLKEYPKLRVTQGRKVLEIRPTIKWDKGKALEFLLESLGFANSNNVLPLYIGDDRTDEDAFKVLRKRRQGFGILVSKTPKETSASYSLQEPSEARILAIHVFPRYGFFASVS